MISDAYPGIAKILAIAFGALIVQYGCGDSLDMIEVTINGHILQVEVARTEEEQVKGLMFRKSMPENHGMLFPYRYDRKLYFHMKDTAIPLSIAFIAAEGTKKEIVDMQPDSLKTVSSRQSVRYALEVNQGLFTRLGIKAGDRVEIPVDFRL
jgi:uncharacterized membrane protein (UPF0127 family)